MESSSSSSTAEAMSLHPPMHRVLDDSSNDNNNDGQDIEPYLVCQWHWEDSYEEITQDCQWRFPNTTITTSGGKYEVTSTCIWETLYANTFTCDVSGFDATGARTITYAAECSASAIGKGNRNACKGVSASIPTRDPTCEDCEWNIGGRSERGVRWLEGDGDCDQECWTATETCRHVAFPKREKKSPPDYHGIPWADSLIETMQWAVLMGVAKEPIAFYDVQVDQPSLQAQDFAQGVTFYCPSGAYQGSELFEVEDDLADGRSGGWGILKGVIILLVASALLVIYLKRYGHCDKRPRRQGSEDQLQKAASRGLMTPTLALDEEQLPSPTSATELPLPANYQPRLRASSSPVLHTMTGDSFEVQDGIWRPKRRRNTTSSSWQEEMGSDAGGGDADDDAIHVLGIKPKHSMVMMLDDQEVGSRSLAPDDVSEASTDFDNILQEVI